MLRSLARAYHSASSYTLGVQCPRKWFYRYVAKIREPEVAWRDVAHYVADKSRTDGVLWWRDPRDSSRKIRSGQRSAALGTEMHARLERWYDGQCVDFNGDLPGKVALSGLHYLPYPTKCHDGGTEVVIGSTPFRQRGDFDPKHVHVVRGIAWTGKIDLLVSAPGEFLRLDLAAPDGWAMVDYKSSGNIADYALKPAELRVDFAANLYGHWACIELGIAELPARWLYFETKDKRRAEPRDAVISLTAATAMVEEASEAVPRFDAMRTEADAPCNTDACTEYGGCMYHKSAGGPCDARRRTGFNLIQLRAKKEGSTMGLPAKAASKFGGLKAGKTEAPKKEEAAAAEPAAEAAEAAPKRGRGRPRKDAAEPEATASSSDETHISMTIPGEMGPVVVSGHCKDVSAAVTALLHA